MTLGTFIILLFTAIFLKRVIKHHRDPLRSIPGPFWARYTRLWYLRQTISGSSRQTLIELHEKHGRLIFFFNHRKCEKTKESKQSLKPMSSGPVVRITPNEFSISDMDVVREIYGPRTQFEKVIRHS